MAVREDRAGWRLVAGAFALLAVSGVLVVSGCTTTPPPAPEAAAASPPSVDPRSEELQRLKKEIIGTWRGEMTQPNAPAPHVEITFKPESPLSAHCVWPADAGLARYPDGGIPECRVFGWLFNEPSPELTYDLVDVLADHTAIGRLTSAHGREVEMRKVTIDPGGTRLTFEISDRQSLPLKYELTRAR
jgi:hypothetical protein